MTKRIPPSPDHPGGGALVLPVTGGSRTLEELEAMAAGSRPDPVPEPEPVTQAAPVQPADQE